jgi:hypothetical protein
VAVTAALLAAGCGGEETHALQRGAGPAAPATAAAATPAAANGSGPPAGIDTTKVPAKYRTLDWAAEDELERTVRDMRDPFQVFADEVKVGSDKDGPPPPELVGALDFEWNELQFTAVITGTAVHKALLIDPRGSGHVVQAGDIIGKTEPRRVTRITRNEVVAKPLVVKPGDKTEESVKRLLSDQELEQLEEP